MLSKLLATLSDTPERMPSTRAYDVCFIDGSGEERKTAVLTDARLAVGDQIRQTLFARHPEATDYTFREFDYGNFQARAVLIRMNDAIHSYMSAKDLGGYGELEI